MFTTILLVILSFYSIVTTCYIIHLTTCSCKFVFNQIMCLGGFLYGCFLRCYSCVKSKISGNWNPEKKKEPHVSYISAADEMLTAPFSEL